MYDRYGDISKFITDPDKLTDVNGECYISGVNDYDIAVDVESCYGTFDEVKPFIAFLAEHINELDNTVQRFDCRNSGGYDPNSDETPFELELISLEKADTIKLDYFCTDVNSQFDVVFEYKNGRFFLRKFGLKKDIPDDWEENITTEKGDHMKFKRFDVLIVGTGISGIYAALNLDPSLNILMLSKRELTLCNSALAQGGVAAVMDQTNDDYELHIKDTLIAGQYKNNLDNVKILVQQGPKDVERLVEKYGVDFDRNEDGSLALTLEGGHSRRRIAHHKDTTGFEIETALIEQVQKLTNVTVINNSVLCRLERGEEIFFADVIVDNVEGGSKSHEYYCADAVILATGGIGRVYDFTTNSAIATGDGIQLAYNLGAEIRNLSYVQFHPTAFADKENPDTMSEGERPNGGTDAAEPRRSLRECFLISEAVRGEGAYLLNCNKERFMPRYEPERKELAPRDVVSNCIMEEQRAVGSDEFWLDISHKDADFIKNRFPMIYNKVLEKGYDMTKEPIPIYPCQHYLMGGINVDGKGATNIPGLYAAGECSHTGVHGANRLASNSLLEALVFSRLIAEDINARTKADDRAEIDYPMSAPEGKELPHGIRTEVRHIMQKAYFVHPNYDEAEKGLARITELKNDLNSGSYAVTPEFVETKSIVTCAYIILNEVMERRNEK